MTANNMTIEEYLELDENTQTLQNREDLTPASIRTSLSDLRHFLAWYETCFAAGSDEALSHRALDLQTITTPALIRSRVSLQKDQRQKPGPRRILHDAR